jgi:hypothetical protein
VISKVGRLLSGVRPCLVYPNEPSVGGDRWEKAELLPLKDSFDLTSHVPSCNFLPQKQF